MLLVSISGEVILIGKNSKVALEPGPRLYIDQS